MTSLEVKARKECLFLILEGPDALEGAASLSGEGRNKSGKKEDVIYGCPFSYFRFCSSDIDDSSNFVRLTMTPKKI